MDVPMWAWTLRPHVPAPCGPTTMPSPRSPAVSPGPLLVGTGRAASHGNRSTRSMAPPLEPVGAPPSP